MSRLFASFLVLSAASIVACKEATVPEASEKTPRAGTSPTQPKTSAPADPKAAPAPTGKDAAEPWRNVLTSPPAVASGTLLVAPPPTRPTGSVPLHATDLGWIQGEQEFGYCGFFGPGMEETRCFHRGISGGSNLVAAAEHRKKLAPITSQDDGPVSWKFGDDVRFSWVAAGAPQMFVLQGSVKGDTQTVVLDRVGTGATSSELEVHPDALKPSRDGARLALVLHGYSGEWTDSYEARVWRTDDLAARAYNGVGMLQHQAGHFAAAAALFHRAAHASAASDKPMYNLACALARLHDPQAGVALSEAIRVGGDEVRKKALKDEDFAASRGEAWFQSSVKLP